MEESVTKIRVLNKMDAWN